MDFKTTVADPALGVDRWVRLVDRQKDTLHVLVNGARAATWEKVERTAGDRVGGPR